MKRLKFATLALIVTLGLFLQSFNKAPEIKPDYKFEEILKLDFESQVTFDFDLANIILEVHRLVEFSDVDVLCRHYKAGPGGGPLVAYNPISGNYILTGTIDDPSILLTPLQAEMWCLINGRPTIGEGQL